MGKENLTSHPLRPMVDEVCRVLVTLNKQLMNQISPYNVFLDFPCPICWFGDMDSKKPIIFTFGINPSNKEFLPRNELPPQYFRGMNGLPVKPTNLIEAYNGYFRQDPYSQWFNPHEKCLQEHGLDASYYGGNANYQLVHIDIFPFATYPKWAELNKKNHKTILHQVLPRMLAIGKELIKELIDYCNPKLIISFGGYDDKIKCLRPSANPDVWYGQITEKQYPPVSGAKKISEGILYTSSGKQIPMVMSSGVLDMSWNKEEKKQHLARLLSIAKQKLP